MNRATWFLLVALGVAGCGGDTTAPIAVETRILDGDGQVRLPGTVLVRELVVQAIDASGEALREGGLPVTWTLVSGGGSLDARDASTDPSGLARAEWRLGGDLGGQALEASVSGTPAVTFNARAIEPGPILFTSDRGTREPRLYAMSIVGDDLVPITTGVFRDRTSAWSPDGATVVFDRVTDADNLMQISIIDLAEKPFAYQQEGANNFVWSPDGSRLAFDLREVVTQGCVRRSVWVVQSDGSDATSLTDRLCGTHNRFPHWSPDGNQLVFENHAEQHSTASIRTIDVDGSNDTQIGTRWGHHPRWLPDGYRVAVGGFRSSGTNSLRILDTTTGVEEVVWTPSAPTLSVLPGGVSPDGRFAVVEVFVEGADSDVFRIEIQTGEAVNLTNRPNGFDGFPSWRPQT